MVGDTSLTQEQLEALPRKTPEGKDIVYYKSAGRGQGIRPFNVKTAKYGGSTFIEDIPKEQRETLEFRTLPSPEVEAEIRRRKFAQGDDPELKAKREATGEAPPKSGSETWESYIEKWGTAAQIPNQYIARKYRPLLEQKAEEEKPIEATPQTSFLFEMKRKQKIVSTLKKQRAAEEQRYVIGRIPEKTARIATWGGMTQEERESAVSLPSPEISIPFATGLYGGVIRPRPKDIKGRLIWGAKEIYKDITDWKLKIPTKIDFKTGAITKRKELKDITPSPDIFKKRAIEAGMKPIPAEYVTGIYEGIREKPLQAGLTYALFVGLPPVISGAKYGIQLAKGLKIAKILKPLAPVAKVTGKAIRYGLPTAYAGSIGARVALEPGGKRVRKLGEITSTEIVPMYLGTKLGTRLAFPIEYKAGFLKEIQKFPKAKQLEFKRLAKATKYIKKYEPAPRKLRLDIEKVPRKYEKVIEKWTIGKKKDIIISGSVAQRLQVTEKTLKEMKLSGDVDFYTNIMGMPKSLATSLAKSGAPIYQKGAKIFYRGIGKIAEFHPISPVAGKATLATTLGTVKKPYLPLGEALTKTPEGVRITKIKYQTLRKLYGGFEQSAYRYSKDIPAYKTVVKGVFRDMRKEAQKALFFKEFKLRRIGREKARFFGFEPKEKLVQFPEIGKKGAISFGLREVKPIERIPKDLYKPREYLTIGEKYPAVKGRGGDYISYPYKPYRPTKPYISYPKPKPTPYTLYKPTRPTPYIPYPVTPTPPYIPYKPIKEKLTVTTPYVPYKPTKPYPVSRPYKAPPTSYLAPYKPYETFTIKTTTELPIKLGEPETDIFGKRVRKKKKRKYAPTYKPSLVGKERYKLTGFTISKPPKFVSLGERPITKGMVQEMKRTFGGVV